MRFGVFVPQGWRMDLVGIDPVMHWGVMDGLARRFDENDDWESLWVYDHFHTVPKPTDEATHEAWSLMAAFAASTNRIRLGQMCTCMAYRNPAYLAKVAATVDVISGGRIEMGIGAGWYEHEWRAYGYGFPEARDRLGALRDGVEIFQQLWTTGTATHEGRYYTVDGAICAPRPLQGTVVDGSARNGIPMWVAGGGEKVTLKIAAQYADYTNYFGDVPEFARKSEILASHCQAVGRDYDEITRSVNFNILIGETHVEVQERVAEYIALRERAGISADSAAKEVEGYRKAGTCGTPDEIATTLTAYGKAGMGYAITYFPEAAYDTSGIDLFERTVLRDLRS
ncbi:MAG: LLM class F420-dependent oxidoreductase [Dermatophilaceae bacterium]|jgi:F420-dependent oxidoreductase-like protein|nr:LLM class F420-dependent oxidoreductase [Dermatophilaceae bacterium]